MKIHNIGIVGLGYVGLTTGIGFSSKGFNVIGIDINKENIKKINLGNVPFYEPGLANLLNKVLNEKKFKANNNFNDLLDCELIFICVGTPSKKDGKCDLTQIESSAIEIGKVLKNMKNNPIIIEKSTVPPGTTQNIILPLLIKNSNKEVGIDFSIAMSPEFIKEGNALNDFLYPDRIVIGAYDKKTSKILMDFFKIFNSPIFIVKNIATAEMIKYVNNAFLSTKISFVNEIANICRLFENVDVTDIAQGIGMDNRISDKFLRAGCGFGGSCYPKDLKALIEFAKSGGYNPSLLTSILEVNENQAKVTVDILKEALPDLTNKKIAILGLAFKPGTSDMREACSLRIINILQQEKNIKIIVYDPKAMEEAQKILGDTVIHANSIKECIDGADACIIVTEWDEFKKLEPQIFVKHMKNPLIVDSRKIYDHEKFSGFVSYFEIGRR